MNKWIIKVKCKCGDVYYYSGTDDQAYRFNTRAEARTLAKSLTANTPHFHHFAVKA